MGLPSRFPVHARHRDGPHRRDDPRAAGAGTLWHLAALFGSLILALAGAPAVAREVKLATWDAGLTRGGPGYLLRDLGKADDPQIAAAVQVLAALDADVVVLTGMDYDLSGLALAALQDRLKAAGAGYPFALPLRPNTGVPTGLDLDHDGALNGAGDAQGFGWFPGRAGIAVLSRLPLDAGALRDHSDFLWQDLPGADLPPDMTDQAKAVQRLANTGFYDLPVQVEGAALHLLIYAATPPVFDGPEDRNGRRNADETGFWLHYLQGELALPAPRSAFVLLGQPNLDPQDGDGNPAQLRALLAGPLLQDPLPRGQSAHSDRGARGDPALDTWVSKTGWGLRLDYVLPSTDLRVTGAGVLWPAPSDPLTAVLEAASDHRPVWVTIALP
jgi:hypothetical protein